MVGNLGGMIQICKASKNVYCKYCDDMMHVTNSDTFLNFISYMIYYHFTCELKASLRHGLRQAWYKMGI